jgi:hypothetical protein
MRLGITCMGCLEVDGRPSEEAVSVEMRDDGLYMITCRRGHTTVTAVQEQKFEILFDLGAMALLDGYPREAVSSIAAALERFQEYYVQVLSLKHGITYDTFMTAWKPISRQSERQLGAFLFLYLVENKKALVPSIVDAKPGGSTAKNARTWTEFRNDVIHKGYIPSTDEVLAYGDLVYQFVYRLIKELRSTSAEFVQKATFHHLQKSSDMAGGVKVSTMSIPTLISLVRGDQPAATFAEALKGLEKYKRWVYHHA